MSESCLLSIITAFKMRTASERAIFKGILFVFFPSKDVPSRLEFCLGSGIYCPCEFIKPGYIKGMTENKKTKLAAAAERALAEAITRKKKSKSQDPPNELGGRDGPEPVRFGDWERKGIAVDF